MPSSFVRPLVDAISAVRGVEAVVLGGSRARGDAAPHSDYDLGIYFGSQSPFHVPDLQRAVSPFVETPERAALTEIGEWGPWIVGGGWLTVEGQAVDLLYRSLDAVENVIDEACEGTVRIEYQPGHPHGFVSSIWLAEVHHCLPLHDPKGELNRLKSRLIPYPRALALALVDRFQWEIGFSAGNAAKAVDRDDRTYVAGAIFRALACAAQVVCAINGTFLMNEKGAIRLAAALPLSPPDLAGRIDRLWGNLSAGEVRQALAELNEIDVDIGRLADAWRAAG